MRVALLVLGLATQAATRFAVTAQALDVGAAAKLCIAVDVSDPRGLWWWEPGSDGCGSRSTGPDVFKAQQGAVTKSLGAVRAGFRLPLHGIPPQRDHLDVRLVIAAGRMRLTSSGEDVPLVYRGDLDIPLHVGR